MLNIAQAFPIVLGQAILPQRLQRTPEKNGESAVMDAEKSVHQYDEAMESKLVLVYAGALVQFHRCRRRTTGGIAIDLCCGPGHFALMLAKYFDFEKVIGVDLSRPMIEAAKTNAEKWGLADRVEFNVGDPTCVGRESSSADILTCNHALHHFEDILVVGKLLGEMNRLAKTDGLVVATDLVRLKTECLTERYTRLIGAYYLARGMDAFQQDFCDSMRAAWTEDEIAGVVQHLDKRSWHHRQQRLLPTIQTICGYPVDDCPRIVRDGVPWPAELCPVPCKMRRAWKVFCAFQ
ncbi:MAG: class I SAM-dependent methyltransferase [Planctomycetota bacterium]